MPIPRQRRSGSTPIAPFEGGPQNPDVLRRGRRLRWVRAWMVVVPVDFAAVAAPALWAPQHAKGIVVLAAATVLLLTGGRFIRARLSLSVLDELPWLLARFATATAAVAIVIALRHDAPETAAFLVLALASCGLLVAGRVLTTQVILWARRRRRVAHATVVVGDGPVSRDLITVLRRETRYGLSVCGLVDDDEPPGGDPSGTPYLGNLADLRRIIDERQVVVVLVAGDIVEETLLELVRLPTRRSWDLLVVPRLHQLHTQVGLPDHVGSIPVMRINDPALSGPAWALKRAFDVVVSAAGLIALAPVLGLLALAVWCDVGRSVLFRQERVGRYGRTFTCYKFRTLRDGTAADVVQPWTVSGDARLGPIGRAIRRSSLDELPQLWNILRGDMTLVGPRPERPSYVEQFSSEIPPYVHRHRVRAGLTGFAQVSGLRGDTSIPDRARADNYYIENWSLWMDAKVLIRTVGEIVLARGR